MVTVFNFKKKFGQNFINDKNLLQAIVNDSGINEKSQVLEIGAGAGTLTEQLALTAQKVISVEIDNDLKPYLQLLCEKHNNLSIVFGDFIKMTKEEIESNFTQKLYVVANLPYYITTPIIFKLLQNENRINEITVMVQKEVAERIVAKNKTKDYGILTLMVNYLGTSDIKLIVPNNSFIPAPNVTSAVIKITKNKRFTVKDEELLFKLIHSSFAQRRKKIINSLESTKFLNMSKPELEKLFNECNISLNARAEELELQDYIKIVDIITNK